MRMGQVPARVLALILWAVTAIIGLWEIVVVREIVFRVYARFTNPSGRYTGEYWAALGLGNWTVLVLALVWLALVVGGAEYHRARVGEPESWRLFGWTIGIEVAILVLAAFI